MSSETLALIAAVLGSNLLTAIVTLLLTRPKQRADISAQIALAASKLAEASQLISGLQHAQLDAALVENERLRKDNALYSQRLDVAQERVLTAEEFKKLVEKQNQHTNQVRSSMEELVANQMHRIDELEAGVKEREQAREALNGKVEIMGQTITRNNKLIVSLQERLDEVQKSEKVLTELVEQLKAENAQLREELEALKVENQALRDRIGELESENRRLKEQPS